ncbi:MAG: CPBP family intramembrane glutamic endopeptidase [Planctomycetota bacterium]
MSNAGGLTQRHVPERAGRSGRGWAALTLLLFVPVPTLGVLLPLWLGDHPMGKASYFLAKAWIYLLPAIWLLAVDRQRLSWSPPRQGGFVVGAVSGLVISGIIIAAYWLVGRHLIDASAARETVAELGLTSLPVYLGLAAFITVFNALMEEYMWRWFVYTRFERLLRGSAAQLSRVGVGSAIVLAALAFGVHHFIAVVIPYGLVIALLATLGVCIGGVWWSWMYARYRSVWPAYLSHAIVDIGVFVVGYWILFA